MKKFVAMAIALGAVLALVTYWNSRRNPADSRGSDGGDNLPLTGEVFPTHGNWISENDLTPTATPTPTESLPTATPTPTASTATTHGQPGTPRGANGNSSAT